MPDSTRTLEEPKISYKDSESIRVEGSELYTEKNPRLIVLHINAKNSYGAYPGAKSVYCVLGEDHKTINDVFHEDTVLYSKLLRIFDEIKQELELDPKN